MSYWFFTFKYCSYFISLMAKIILTTAQELELLAVSETSTPFLYGAIYFNWSSRMWGIFQWEICTKLAFEFFFFCSLSFFLFLTFEQHFYFFWIIKLKAENVAYFLPCLMLKKKINKFTVYHFLTNLSWKAYVNMTAVTINPTIIFWNEI